MYLVEKWKSLGGSILVHLEKYIEYKRVSKKIDEQNIFEQINKAQEELVKKISLEERQIELWKLAHNLLFVEKMVSINIEPKEYEFYLKNKEEFSLNKYIHFIKKYDQGAEVLRQEESLTFACKEAERFYGLSYERDISFSHNIRFSLNEEENTSNESNAAVVITGGFHSRNFQKILKDRNITYIQILPKFDIPENYVDPYYFLLAGGESKLMGQVRASTSMIALRSMFTELGFDSDERDVF